MPSRSRMWQAVTRVRFAAPSSGASKAGAPARLEDAITLEPPLPRFRLQLFDKGKVKILERRNRGERGVLVAHGLEDIDNRFLYFYPLIHNPILSAATKTSLPSPELPGGEARAFSHRLELGQSDRGRADSRARAEVRTRHDIFATHQLGVLYQALCDRLRVFNEVAIVAGYPRNEHLPLGQLDILPHTPLMLMAGVRSLNGIALRAHLQDEIHDVSERDIVFMGTV